MLSEDFAWELTTIREAVGDDVLELVALDGFERNSARLGGALRGGTAEERADLSPMFGVIWGAARAIVDRMATMDLAGERVLELGCGLALPGLVAARQGAADVVVTDQHPHTGDFLARNLAHTGIAGVRYARLDWRRPAGLPERGFDRVLASDVLFAWDLPELVVAMFDRYLAPDGVGWLTDPGRAWLPEVEIAARQAGLRCEVDVVEVVRPGFAEEVFFLELRRGAGSG